MLSLICKIMGHRINRKRVWHDQLDFRTSCDRCNVPMIRSRHGWRPFSSTLDADTKRDAHPHQPL